MAEHYDIAVIGSGQAGSPLAAALAEGGSRVALIEGHMIGGTCVNTGCTPTKTLRKTARVAHLARNAARFGVSTGPVTVDFTRAMARMRERVELSRAGLEKWLGGVPGLDVVRGWARFDGPAGTAAGGGFRLQITATEARSAERTITANQVYLNTGTRPSLAAVPGLDQLTPLDNASLLALDSLPGRLVVVGGSYIGLELGQIFRRLGSEVTIIQPTAHVAGREDPDVSEAIEAMLRAEGITLLTGQAISRAEAADGGPQTLVLADGQRVSGTHVLFATGRVPNSDRLNLASVGVVTDPRGFITTDSLLGTTVPGIWAIGDVNGRGAFTHTSYHDHEIVLAHRAGNPRSDGPLHQWQDADQRPTTYAMFTDPPLGRVGMSLTDAEAAVKQGRHILAATHSMADVSRAKEESETTGLIRLVVDGDTRRLLGATVLGINGDEVIAVLSNFMATGAPIDVMRQALPVHPTVAEFLPTVIGKLKAVTVP